jgi:hypothetical protein
MKKRPRRRRARAVAGRRVRRSRWLKFVGKHGVVLASARGPVPNLAEAVVGEPIVGSWWANPKGRAIFAALSELDDDHDVRCFRLINGKVALVHRRVWPALARLAEAGVLAGDQVAAVQQEHLPTGEHRNIVMPFPDWVDDATAQAAKRLGEREARAMLPWLEARGERPGGARRPAKRAKPKRQRQR